MAAGRALPTLLGRTQGMRVVIEKTFITVKDDDAEEEQNEDCNPQQRKTRRMRTEPARTSLSDDEDNSQVEDRSRTTQGSCEENMTCAMEMDPDDVVEITRLLEEGSADGVAHAIAAVRGNVRRLSLEAMGCHAVQLALLAATPEQALELAQELRGHVLEVVRSPSGNYAVQKVVLVLPPQLSIFVADELLECTAMMTHHCAGSRVISRILESAGGEEAARRLADQVLAEDVCKVCRHRFGRHVISAILEHGTPVQKTRVALALRGEMVRFAKHQNAWLVAEKALTHALPADRNTLAEELLAHPNILVSVARHATGQVVIEALARLPGTLGHKALEYLSRARAKLQKDKYARQMLLTLAVGAPQQH